MSKKGKFKKIIVKVAIVVAVLAAAGAAGFGVQWLLSQNKGGEPTQERSLTEQIQDVRSSGDFTETSKKIDDALNNSATSNDERYMLYVQQGSAYEDQQDPANAIESYKKAEAIKETYEISRLLINVYTTAGNKEHAINYCKKAITQIQQENNPFADEDKELLEQMIVNLGGQV